MCPLCCENLELDDLNFLPCPCGYKVCLFCWNRIKTSENDPKCPLCRRTYSENPAKFEPLSAEQLQKLKSKKKQEDVKKKQKLAEDRKLLADVRVVRKNLIFINELPLNFSKDPKTYQKFLNLFKQAGHVKKVSVLNSSKNYAGQKAPFARAYVTYQKNEDALRALKIFENVEFEGRELKISLGTTKYCSNYIKNANCTNKECVYLHEQADAEASFTKEQIHAGKHIEYGQKLHEQYSQYLHSMQINRSLSSAVPEEKKLDSQQTENLEKEIIIENNLSFLNSQHSSKLIQNERSSSAGSDSENLKVFKQFQEIMKAANLTDSSLSIPYNQCDAFQNFLSSNQRDVLHKLITQGDPINSSSSDLPQNQHLDFTSSSYKEKFRVNNESVIPNGKPFHEETFPVKESLMSRLNLFNSHNEHNLNSTESFRSSYKKDVRPLSHIANADIQNITDHELESKDDCGLDFDPVQTALGGLGELVISEKQNARIDVNSLNSLSANALKKQSVFPAAAATTIQQTASQYKSQSNQPMHQRIHPTVFSPNSLIPNSVTSSIYQTIAGNQSSPVVDFYNQPPFRNTSGQQQTIPRSSASQRNQIPPFANTLTIQLPRFSSGMSLGSNSMVNGYSPQQYISQISPQDAFILSQQNQSFENYSQPQFSNFEQFTPFSGANVNLGQRLRNEAMTRHQQLQRLNSYSNTTSQTESVMRLPKGANTFP